MSKLQYLTNPKIALHYNNNGKSIEFQEYIRMQCIELADLKAKLKNTPVRTIYKNFINNLIREWN